MLKPVHALVGTDLFLQLETLAALLHEAPPDVQRTDLDGETAQLADVLDELRSFAMFSSSKFVVVRSADEFISRYREPLEHYVAKPASGSILVLRMDSLPSNQRIHKLISASGQVHDCHPPKPKDLGAWVSKRASAAHQLRIAPDAVRILVNHVGNNLGRLDNELAKLALQTDGVADADTVARSVAFQREQEMWHMTDELAAGKVTSALRRWRQLVQLDSSAEYRAITWLAIWLEKVRKALAMRRAGQNDATIARDLKIWPFEQQRAFMQTAAMLGEEGVNRLVHLLTQIDYRSKTGLGDMAENVERFLLATRQLTGELSA